MPKLKYKHLAQDFAKEWGWDGVLWSVSRDGYEMYEPGLINDYSEVMPLTTPFDNTPRTIVVDENGARWLDPDIVKTWGDARGRYLPRYELNGRTIPNIEDFYD